MLAGELMQSFGATLRASLKVVAVTAFCVCASNANGQATQKPPQQLNIPDPTPRPPDLEREYGGDPAEAARQQQLAALRVAQVRLQVVQATDKLLQLAQELEADVQKRENGTAMTPEVVKLEQIEKLAKSVKEKTKSK